MAEAVVGSMLGKLQQLAIREGQTLLAVNEDIQSLRDKLMWMQAFLRDVQPSRRIQPNELIKVWLQQTRDAVFVAEDAVDQYFIQIDLSRFPSWSRAILSFFASFTTQVQVRYMLSRNIKSINARLEGIISNKDRYRMGESTTLGSTWTPSVFTSPLSEKMDTVVLPLVGRDELMIKLKDLVCGSNGGHQYVISVTGESGVGKTKLVRDLYDRRQTLSQFDIHMWVSFGLNLSALDVLKIIIGYITDDEECPNNKISDKLENKLKQKKYLLVIDAELSNSEWNHIFSMLPKNVNAGSRLVRISQSQPEKPPSPYGEGPLPVERLRDEEVVMNLFTETLLKDGRNGLPDDNEIKGYKEKILDNTKGLPLAVVLLSGLLRTKEYPNEWNKVFEYLDKMQSKRINKILSLCFDDLHYDMKSCLLYFAALPVNTFVSAQNIVRMWMAEGFLTPKAKTMENLGQQYLKDLIDRCFVNFAPKGYAVPGYEVAVQSKVHSFLQLEAQEQSFVEIHIGDDTPALSTVRRLSLQNHRDKYAALGRPLPKLRAILSNFEAEQGSAQVGETETGEAGGEQERNLAEVGRNPARYCPNFSVRGANKRKKQANSCVKELLQNSKFLRVIHFNGLDVDKELPPEVGSVVNLQYLRVTTCSLEKIPPSIGRLCNLQTLDVRRTKVRSLPAELWTIQMLRHVLGDHLILPKRVGLLRKLQTLRSVKPDEDATHGWDDNTFTTMARLWYLDIRNSKVLVANNRAALVKAVALLKYLVVLTIEVPTIPSEVFTGSNLPRLKAMKLVGKLDLLEDIHKMQICTRLPNLVKLRLKKTEVSQKFINQFKDLHSLSTLALESTSYMEKEIIFSDGFRSLKELMVHAKDLKRIEIHESALPMLKDLDIVSRSNDLCVDMHGHSNLVEHIKAEDKTLFEIMDNWT